MISLLKNTRIFLLIAVISCAAFTLPGCLGEYEATYDDEGGMPKNAAHSAPQQDPKLPDSTITSTATARITLRKQASPQQDAPFIPAPPMQVELQWLDARSPTDAEGQPQKPKVLEIYKASSDAKGVVVFPEIRIPKNPSQYILRAAVEEHGMTHFTKPLSLDPSSGEWTTHLDMMVVSGDPNHILGGTLITTASIPQRMEQHPAAYGYVQFQQVLELRVDSYMIYNTGSAVRPEHSRGVAFEVPLKASSVSAQVVAMVNGQMRDGSDFGQVEVADSVVYYKGLIYPEGADKPQIRLMVQFFLEADGSELSFEQPLRQYWDDARFAFTRETDLPEHPELSITLAAPQFTEISNQAQAGIMEGRKVTVARKPQIGILKPGTSLHIQVDGLPYPEPALPWYALALSGTLAIAGIGLGYREFQLTKARRARLQNGDPSLLSTLSNEIDALYSGLELLRQDTDAGLLSPSQGAQEEERLKMRLVLLIQQRDKINQSRN